MELGRVVHVIILTLLRVDYRKLGSGLIGGGDFDLPGEVVL